MKKIHYKSDDNLIVDYCKSWNNNKSFFLYGLLFGKFYLFVLSMWKADPNLQYVVVFISIENICDIFQYRTVLCRQEPPVSALENK